MDSIRYYYIPLVSFNQAAFLGGRVSQWIVFLKPIRPCLERFYSTARIMDTHPEDLQDTMLSGFMDAVVNKLLHFAAELRVLYTTSDASAYIAASVYGVSIIMTLAILDQVRERVEH